MLQVSIEQNTGTQQRYAAMCERVSTFTDRLGTPVDPGIFETVVALNLLGLPTFQSCEGHLDHGSAYPWVICIDQDRSRAFNRMWLYVCDLEKQARDTREKDAYDCYLSADIQLRACVTQWEVKDHFFERITALFDAFYTGQSEQINSARLLVRRLRPGTYRLEPGFSHATKELPAQFAREYLASGQAEMQRFTSFLQRRIFSGDEYESISEQRHNHVFM